jgi:hypothetical protein
MKTTMAGLALVALVVSASFALAQEPQPGATPSFRDGVLGAWKLEKNLSDTADRMGGARGSSPGRPPGGMGGGGITGGMGGGGGRGGGGGMGGMGGGGGRSGGGGMGGGQEGGRPGGADPAAIMAALQPAAGMTIVQNEDVVIVTNTNGVTRKFVANDKKNELLTGDGVIKYRAKWSGPTLTIESELDEGPKVTVTYIPMTLTNQLLVIVRVAGEGGMGTLLAHHVFVRSSPM